MRHSSETANSTAARSHEGAGWSLHLERQAAQPQQLTKEEQLAQLQAKIDAVDKKFADAAPNSHHDHMVGYMQDLHQQRNALQSQHDAIKGPQPANHGYGCRW